MVRGTADALAHPWTLTQRYLANQIDRATWRTTLHRRVSPALALGVEWNSRVGEVGPLVNWRLTTERGARPSLMLGTSSDRIGTPSGRAYYLTAGKSLRIGNRPLGPYAGLLWSTHDDALLTPLGVNVPLSPRWSAQYLYDGRRSHAMLTYSRNRVTLGLLAVGVRDPGLNVSIGY